MPRYRERLRGDEVTLRGTQEQTCGRGQGDCQPQARGRGQPLLAGCQLTRRHRGTLQQVVYIC